MRKLIKSFLFSVLFFVCVIMLCAFPSVVGHLFGDVWAGFVVLLYLLAFFLFVWRSIFLEQK